VTNWHVGILVLKYIIRATVPNRYNHVVVNITKLNYHNIIATIQYSCLMKVCNAANWYADILISKYIIQAMAPNRYNHVVINIIKLNYHNIITTIRYSCLVEVYDATNWHIGILVLNYIIQAMAPNRYNHVVVNIIKLNYYNIIAAIWYSCLDYKN